MDTVLNNSKSKKLEKLERVLSHASELFANSEYHQVSMEDIASRAAVGKGTLYNLFNSKDDLYFSIIRNRLRQLLDVLKETYDMRFDTMNNLRSLILHLHKFMSKYQHFYRIWKREEGAINGSRSHKEIRELQDQMIELVVRILRKGESEDVVRRGMDHKLTARLVLGMVDGLNKTKEKVYEREHCIDDLLRTLVYGIGTEKADTQVRYDHFRHSRGGGSRD